VLHGPHQLTVVDGASRLFAEPGTLETAARLSADWLTKNLTIAVEPLALMPTPDSSGTSPEESSLS
jgi:hypothetical protein